MDRNMGTAAQAGRDICCKAGEGRRGGQVHVTDRVIKEREVKRRTSLLLRGKAQTGSLRRF